MQHILQEYLELTWAITYNINGWRFWERGRDYFL